MSELLDANVNTPPSHGIGSSATPGVTRGIRTTADSNAEGRLIVGVSRGNSKKRKVVRGLVKKFISNQK